MSRGADGPELPAPDSGPGRALQLDTLTQNTYVGDPTLRFARNLPARVSGIRDAVTTARNAPTLVNMTSARRAAHQLAGTAGMFGRHDVGDAARAIDDGLTARPVLWDDLEIAAAELVSRGWLRRR